MSKCKYLIDISPYDPLCDHPCRLYGGEAVEAECETCQYRIEDLERENTKLKELCAGLWSVMWACAEQRCPHRHEDCFVVVNGNGDGPKGHGECWYKRRLRELRVVDE